MRVLRTLVVALLLAATTFAWLSRDPGPDPTPRIFTAARILTMEPEPPDATAVAVRDDRITAVGSLDEIRATLGDAASDYALDERFAGKFVLPGFVDPHIHPSLAATILSMEIVSAMAWTTPAGRTEPVRGREAFLARLRELDRAYGARDDPDGWLLVWGHHAPYHGALTRADLDAVSSLRPILVWQRSVHELFLNTQALAELGLHEEDFAAHEQADWETGHLWEGALFTLGAPATRILAAPGRYRRGLAMMSEVIHRGGLTTVGEQGFPQVTKLGEWLLLWLEMRKGVPYRFVLVPNAMYLLRKNGDAAAAEREAAGMLARSSSRIRVVKHAKYYADGAIFSQLMQMREPYLDGHHGEWMMPPEDQAAVLDAFWREGWGLHVHVNGDAGLDRVLDQIEAQQAAHPAPGRRIVLEHYGFAREDQHARVAKLGIDVSNNAYYLHELAPIYAEHGLGPERAADISPLGGLARAGVPISFHSDFLMAPAEPLLLAWVAVNRVASDGRVWGAHQKLPLDRALRAITIEGARSLGLEDEIGSIRPGKRADFTILERDPTAVDPLTLKDIPIWGTVLDGRPHPIRRN
ncbi:MAG: amidohydrolase [Myxococcales bacterium]|nr:amidohydrolase [Myxococcales bacterium]